MGFVLILAIRTMHGPPPVFILQEDSRQPSGDFARNLPERHHAARTNRAFDFEIVAEVVMEFL